MAGPFKMKGWSPFTKEDTRMEPEVLEGKDGSKASAAATCRKCGAPKGDKIHNRPYGEFNHKFVA